MFSVNLLHDIHDTRLGGRGANPPQMIHLSLAHSFFLQSYNIWNNKTYHKNSIKRTHSYKRPYPIWMPKIAIPYLDAKNSHSCTPDREILHFTPCEKFLSHPRYLTPVAPCVQMFFLTLVV